MPTRYLVGALLVLLGGGSLWAGGGGHDVSPAEHGRAEGSHAALRALHRPVGFVFDGALTDAFEFFNPSSPPIKSARNLLSS
jgi:hypothetical protein